MKKGFTLIELLIVIAIIGILSEIVLTSLSSAREKAKDARIMAEVRSIRETIETNSANGSTYADLVSGDPSNRFAAIPTNPEIVNLLNDIISQQIVGLYGADSDGLGVTDGTIVFTKDATSPATGYALYAKLNGGGVLCTDSLGVQTETATWPGDTQPVDDTVATTCQ